MTENSINNTVIVSEDIFMKAAIEYCNRTGLPPFGTSKNRAFQVREELADLLERINSLKSVGAL